MSELTAIIQARTGSTRLPGKVMYPLDGQPVLEHVVTRTAHADSVNTVVVATSTEPQDNVIAQFAPTFGTDVVRGSESNVLSRFQETVEKSDPDIILRITGDCPLISPKFIDTAVERLQTETVDYVCAGLDRTFPRGVTCEAFTTESFERMSEKANEPRHREHVTPYYREHPEEFELENVYSSDVFDQPDIYDRTDLRLTLDEAADYELLYEIYRGVDFKDVLPVTEAINFVDSQGLATLNNDVQQKQV